MELPDNVKAALAAMVKAGMSKHTGNPHIMCCWCRAKMEHSEFEHEQAIKARGKAPRK